MNRIDCHTDQGFIEQFCAHSMTRYGLCVFCGGITTPGMLSHIDTNYRAGDCPWCAYSEPDSIDNGSPIDWICKKRNDPCCHIRGESQADCKDYWPRKVEVKK